MKSLNMKNIVLINNTMREFCALSMEFLHKPTYLMRLIPRDLSGQVIKWFTKLSPPLESFDKLVYSFIQHYSYNIEHDASMLDLCNTKQKVGESFITFCEGWRKNSLCYP